MTIFAYFLRPIGMDGPIKIGSSNCPTARLHAYQAWSPWPLEIAAQVEGDRRLEFRFHAAFALLHSHHEWFRSSPELRGVIDAINAGRFDVADLPPPHRVCGGRARGRKWTPHEKRTQRTKRRLRNYVYKYGIRAPDHIEALAAELNDLAGEDLRRAEAEIEAYIANPLPAVIYPHPWAEKAFARFPYRKVPPAKAA